MSWGILKRGHCSCHSDSAAQLRTRLTKVCECGIHCNLRARRSFSTRPTRLKDRQAPPYLMTNGGCLAFTREVLFIGQDLGILRTMAPSSSTSLMICSPALGRVHLKSVYNVRTKRVGILAVLLKTMHREVEHRHTLDSFKLKDGACFGGISFAKLKHRRAGIVLTKPNTTQGKDNRLKLVATFRT